MEVQVSNWILFGSVTGCFFLHLPAYRIHPSSGSASPWWCNWTNTSNLGPKV